MNICITSDIHFHSGNGDTKQVSEDEIFEVFNQIVDYCVNHKIEHLYILGDLFHVRGKIHVSTFNRVHDLFKEVTAKGIKIGLLGGNHDQVYNEDEKTTSTYSLQEVTGVTLINWKNFQHGNCNFVGIPYLNTKTEFAKSLEEMKQYIKEGMVNILFTHGVVSGSMISSGYSFSKSTGVDAGLDVFDQVWAGHVHIPQTLFKDRAIVTGSPLTHTKKDQSFPQLKDSPTNNPRGFWILDTETGNYDQVFTNYTKFLTYQIESKKELESTLSSWNERDFLFLTVDATDIEQDDELVKLFTNDKIDWDFVKPPKTTEIRLVVEMGASEEEITKNYIDLKCEGFDKSLLNKFAEEIIGEYDLLESV
jgi:DNA repair exonuclease SbcCD nuclease subunit